MSFRFAICATVMLACVAPAAAVEKSDRISVDRRPDRLRITIGGKPFADYVFRHRKTFRPYFTNVHSPAGIQVTRHHPPRKGIDSVDHDTMHPGIWLAFGDLSGADFWRNKGRVEHVKFTQPPKIEEGQLTFAVRNRYRDARRTICTEDCRHTVSLHGRGCLITYDSTFRGEKPFAFGDQEEMGLGIRVAAPLRVRGGNGRIRNAEGGKDEKQVRGSNAAWCDYSGTIDGHRAGMLLMPHPKNFRKSWYHARNYGFVTANPFGRNALTGGKKSRVVVEPGKPLRLRFAVFAYSLPNDQPLTAKQAKAIYAAYTGRSPKP